MVGTPLFRLADPEPGRGGILSLRRKAAGSREYGLGKQEIGVPHGIRFQEMKPAAPEYVDTLWSPLVTAFRHLTPNFYVC